MPLEELPIPPTLSLLLRDRASRIPNTPLLSFCNADGNIVEYDAKSLNALTDLAASYYRPLLPPIPSNPDDSSVIAILGVSSIEYITTFFALQRLGHTALLPSTRLAAGQTSHVLMRTECKALIVGGGHRADMQEVKMTLPKIPIIEMVPLEKLKLHSTAGEENQEATLVNGDSQVTEEVPKRPAWILHSSGSTGLPKPITFAHSSHRFPSKLALAMEMEPSYYGLTTLPLFHAFGIYTLVFALQTGVKTAFLDTSVPITGSQVVEAMTRSETRILYLVPYVLRLIADAPGGIDVLRACKTVVVGGSACPPALGDELVREGVIISNGFGSTELGGVMRSNDVSVELWNWLVIEPPWRKTLFFEPREDGLWELCAGKNFRLFAGEEARDVDGVFRSRDLWERHPEHSDLYRHHSRADDLLILENGENANPIPLEFAAESVPEVDSAVVFGAGRAYLGMFILLASQENGEMRRLEEVVVEEVWKRIEPVNREVPAYARIGKDAIAVVKSTERNRWHKTAKGNIMRARLCREFEADIDAFYQRAEKPNDAPQGKPATVEGMQRLVKATIADNVQMDVESLDEHADLFAMGVDSLGAISIRQRLVKQVDFGDARISENVVFEHPTVQRLAEHLWKLLGGSEQEADDSFKLDHDRRLIMDHIGSFIDKFSDIRPPFLATESPNGCLSSNRSHILLTGAAGYLGSHLVRHFLSLPHVAHITCLVRASSRSDALSRVLSSPALHNSPSSFNAKLTALPCDLTHALLGLPETDYTQLVGRITHVIHAAWSVNYNLSLDSFAPDLLGLQNLLRFTLSSPRVSPPRFTFISSISVGISPLLSEIPESPLPLKSDILPPLGYAQSKHIAEHILSRISDRNQMTIDVVRAGQLVGDTDRGMWNDKETWPAMMSTALSLGVLPKDVDGERETGLKWLPIDVAARAVMELAGLEREYESSEGDRNGLTVYNLVHPTVTSWEEAVIPALRKEGMVFETVAGQDWVRMLKEAKDNGKELGQAGKLVGHFETRFAKMADSETSPVKIDMSNALQYSTTLRNVPAVDENMIQKFLEYWMNGPWKDLGSGKDVIANH